MTEQKTIASLVREFRAAKAAQDQAKARYNAAAEAVKNYMAEKAINSIMSGKSEIVQSVYERRDPDVKKLKKERPDIYEAYLKEPSIVVRLTLKSK